MCRVCGRRGHNHSLMIILTYSTIRMINVTLCAGVCACVCVWDREWDRDGERNKSWIKLKCHESICDVFILSSMDYVRDVCLRRYRSVPSFSLYHCMRELMFAPCSLILSLILSDSRESVREYFAIWIIQLVASGALVISLLVFGALCNSARLQCESLYWESDRTNERSLATHIDKETQRKRATELIKQQWS